MRKIKKIKQSEKNPNRTTATQEEEIDVGRSFELTVGNKKYVNVLN